MRQTGSQVYGGRRFANPSFLIGNSNHTGRHGLRVNSAPLPPSKTYPQETNGTHHAMKISRMEFDTQISGKNEECAHTERDFHANSVESDPETSRAKQLALAGVASLAMVVFVGALLKTLA